MNSGIVAAVTASMLGAALLGASCSSDNTGFDNPPTPTPTRERTDTGAPATTPAATPIASPGPPAIDDVDSARSAALEFLSMWLAVPSESLNVRDAERVVWPNHCLGLPRPDLRCEPDPQEGFRVAVADSSGGIHTVRISRVTGDVGWAGGRSLRGRVVSSDGSAMVIDAGGTEHRFTVVPGTRNFAHALSDPAIVGTEVAVTFDDHPSGADPPVLVLVLSRS